MEPVEAEAERAIRERKLIDDGETVVAGVSGGLDSMVLLDALCRLAPRHGWSIVAAHFNHRLRGADADRDEELVRQAAETLGVGFTRDEADVARAARESGISVEMAARQLRHRFLAEAARAAGARTIALAHQADDQVETFFLRLLRGAGSEGLSGMRPGGRSPADPELRIARPLLELRREELREYAKRRRLRWREDRTNHETRALRNRVRHILIPLLEEEFQPGLYRVILRVAELLGTEADWVGESARRWLESGAPPFEALHPALQRRVVYEQLLRLTFDPGYDVVEELRRHPERRVMIRRGLHVWREPSGMLRFEEVGPLQFRRERALISFHGQRGRVEFGGLRVRWALRQTGRWRRPPPRREGKEWFDADAVGARAILRHWQPGDRFRPIGAAVPTKLQDLFTNAKIPAARRRELAVAAREDGLIFWVEGLRIGELCKVRERTRRVLIWSWERSD
ncbi:MAG: tRNA lysidine(34) synthetase TilS [Verrucomicrobia bacterium]|nr:tRNA lysidine(34) synthetase TilS [Verrucomicrobiota bacterium]